MNETEELNFVKGPDNKITNLRHKSKNTNKYHQRRGGEDDDKPKMKPLIESKSPNPHPLTQLSAIAKDGEFLKGQHSQELGGATVYFPFKPYDC